MDILDKQEFSFIYSHLIGIEKKPDIEAAGFFFFLFLQSGI